MLSETRALAMCETLVALCGELDAAEELMASAGLSLVIERLLARHASIRDRVTWPIDPFYPE